MAGRSQDADMRCCRQASTVTRRKPLPIQALSMLSVAASVTERSVRSAVAAVVQQDVGAPMAALVVANAILRVFQHGGVRGIPIVATRIPHHGRKPSSSATRSTPGRRPPKGGRTIPGLRRSRPRWQNCKPQAPPGRASCSQRKYGWVIVWFPNR